ncbi:conjugal transfer protein [Enterococcus sp. LJL128]
MDLQKILLVVLGLVFVVYMGTLFILRRKKKNGLGKSKKQRKKVIEKAVENQEPIPFYDPVSNESNKELYTEKGDRTHWYKITITFDTKESIEYDFYSYSDDLSRDEILDKRFYVNDREILIVNEDGEHYINRSKIDQIDFLERKILGNQIDTKEAEDSFEEQIQEIEKEESKEPEIVPKTFVEVEEISEEKEEIFESALSKRGRFFKAKKEKRPSTKKIAVKKYNQFFLIAMVLFLFSGVFSLFRSFGIGGRVDKVQAVQKELSDKVTNESGSGESYPFSMNSFMSDFISDYMYLSANSDEMKARKETLKKYYAENVSADSEEVSTARKLISSELSEVTEKDTYSTAVYRIVYSVDIAHEEIKKEKNGDSFEDVSYIEYETEEKTTLLSIDFVEKEGKFSIISTPYFSAIKKEVANFEGVKKQEESGTALDADKLKDVNTFLDIFFEKYATGTNEELQYFMKNVESLGGGYRVDTIETPEAFSHDEFTTVYVKVIFAEKESNLKHKEAFSLKLVKEEDQYKISELKHNLGGF